MKFLIFNLLVLSCLGYIIMGKPNENFLQWASNTKEKVSNLSKEDFLKKIDNAIKVKKNNNLNNDEKQNTDIENKIKNLDNNNILETVKLELSKFDKKLDETLKQIRLHENNSKFDNTTSVFPSERVKVINDQTKDVNDKEILPFKDDQFMSSTDRSNALADLITDMELYGIKN